MSQAKVEAVNKLLLDGEPGNITTDEHAGYTGYRPQAIIDAMNDVFWGEWGFSEVGSEIVPGDKGGLAVAQVQVWLAGIEFKPTSWGQNRVTRGDIGDARKGAQTDAIKKALSYFSIGNRAYQGLLKDEAKGNAQQNGNKPSAKNAPKLPAETIEMNRLLGEFQSLYPSHCSKTPTWRKEVLRKVLDVADGQEVPTAYTADDVSRMSLYIASKKQERANKAVSGSAA